MPGWEKIEFKKRSLKRKETYNDFGRKIRFEPLESIPKVRKFDTTCEEKETCRETLIWSEDVQQVAKTNDFIKLAKSKKFTEEQALYILKYHNFDETLAESDLHIYKPLRGLRSDNDRYTINFIVDNICDRIESGKNRDFNEILVEFPGHSIGELLDFHANNRLYIKKKTMKKKERLTGVRKTTFSAFSRHVDYRNCGPILQKKYNEDNFDLSDLLKNFERSALDKYLLCTKNASLDDISLEQINQTLNHDSQPSMNTVSDSDFFDEEVSVELKTLLKSLEEIECWMTTTTTETKEEDSIRHKWDNMDVSLLLLGLHKFGRDFVTLSNVISTKTAAMVETFYLTFKDRFGFERIIVEEAELT